MKKEETLESLKSKTLWHAKRTSPMTLDDKSVYRALVYCWGCSAGPVNGDEHDMELNVVVGRVLSKVSWENIQRLAYEIDGEFEPRHPEDPDEEDERDLLEIVSQELYRFVMHKSEREWLDRED